MNFSFEMELFGVTMTVEGVFDTGEPESRDCPEIPPSFEIERVTCFDVDLKGDEFPDELLAGIERTAFEKAAEEARDFI